MDSARHSPEPADMGAPAVLADGTAVQVRPITADDVPGLVEFHEGLSFETVYRRFFGVHPHLGPVEAEHFCTVDSVMRFALVALVDTEIVGVARMERLDPASTAEVAFVVADRFQHRGLGCILAQRLAAAARERGVDEFVAEILPENHAMLRLLPDAGFEVATSVGGGVVHLTCSLTGSPAGSPTGSPTGSPACSATSPIGPARAGSPPGAGGPIDERRRSLAPAGRQGAAWE